jgi:CheY-like chemotaxis protein
MLTKPVKSSSLFDALMTVFDQIQSEQHSSIRQDAQLSMHEVEMLADQYPLRILLAEDVVVNQKFALLALERIGYRADVAGNGQEALEAIRRQPYDVVLMDINMPIMDGYETSRQIHELWKNGSRPFDIPRPWIIAMTANALQGDRELALEAGADDYISKPVYLNELQVVLTRAGHVRTNSTIGQMKTMEETKLNRAFLQNLIDLPDGKSLITAYLEEAPTILERIKIAVASADARGLKDAAHALKGSSLYVGAVEVADLAKELELAGRTNELENIKVTFAHLKQSLETTSVILAGYI